MTIIKKKQNKMKQITNNTIKVDSVIDVKSIKHVLAVLDARVREAPLS